MTQSRLVLLASGRDVEGIARHLLGLVGRGTFPMTRLVNGHESCAFLFNDLLASGDDGETVITWILTADAMTYVDAGVVGIRPEMAENGAPTAQQVIQPHRRALVRCCSSASDLSYRRMPMPVIPLRHSTRSG